MQLRCGRGEWVCWVDNRNPGPNPTRPNRTLAFETWCLPRDSETPLSWFKNPFLNAKLPALSQHLTEDQPHHSFTPSSPQSVNKHCGQKNDYHDTADSLCKTPLRTSTPHITVPRINSQLCLLNPTSCLTLGDRGV